MYLEENLNLTPQSMSDKATALDELEEMHQQVFYVESRNPCHVYPCIFLFNCLVSKKKKKEALVSVISVVYINLWFDSRP